MNRDALEWWFEEYNIEYEYDAAKNCFILPLKSAIGNDTLGEIAACGGNVVRNDRYDGFTIYDAE